MIKKIKEVVLLMLVVATHNALAQGVKFEQVLSWQAIKEKAKDENKYIFIDVYATWCGPCKQMDETVYNNEKVGSLLNGRFISVKVQEDQNIGDHDYVKSWYADAKAIYQEFRVEALPTFLFLSPEGKLVNRGIGFHDINAFIRMSELTLINPIEEFNESLMAYKQGRRDYEKMSELIQKTLEINKDEKLAAEMSKDYKINFLDRLSEKNLLNKKYLDFIGDHFTLINSHDNFFKLCYEQSAKVDQTKEYNGGGWAEFQVTQTISREDIDPILWNGKEPRNATPNWNSLEAFISKKYPKIDIRKIMLNKKIQFYATIGSWYEFVKYRSMEIKLYPPKIGGGYGSDAWNLNTNAWFLFLHIEDPKILNEALRWSQLTVELTRTASVKLKEDQNVQFYDTKANLLYKLGRVKEAIECEKLAIQINLFNAKKYGKEEADINEDYKQVILKMELGEPTWRMPK
nr:DUF255 domain-containing protein [Pedobacter panaciterrae]